MRLDARLVSVRRDQTRIPPARSSKRAETRSTTYTTRAATFYNRVLLRLDYQRVQMRLRSDVERIWMCLSLQTQLDTSENRGYARLSQEMQSAAF